MHALHCSAVGRNVVRVGYGSGSSTGHVESGRVGSQNLTTWESRVGSGPVPVSKMSNKCAIYTIARYKHLR